MRDEFRRKKRARDNRKGEGEHRWFDEAGNEQRRVNRKRQARKKARIEQIEVEELMEMDSAWDAPRGQEP